MLVNRRVASDAGIDPFLSLKSISTILLTTMKIKKIQIAKGYIVTALFFVITCMCKLPIVHKENR